MSQIDPDQYEAYSSVIRDGQMPQERVPGFLQENPEFAAWYRGQKKPSAVKTLATASAAIIFLVAVSIIGIYLGD